MKRYNLFFVLGVCTLVSLVVCYGAFMYIPERERESVGAKGDCMVDIARMSNSTELTQYGNAFFGGDRGYDLRCARSAYEQAILHDPKSDRLSWYQLGRIDFLEGDFSAALKKFDKQIFFFKNEIPNVYYMIGLTNGYSARKTGSSTEWTKAEEGFKQYLVFFPESPWGRTDLAWILFSQGKYEEMKPILEKGLEYEPNHSWLLNMYGLALLNTDKKGEAHGYFLHALTEANKLTPSEWGSAYPGNDPHSWAEGLAEMRESIQHNTELSITP